MKKLKLQKALLAICLALPITLTMRNETNATENANKQKPVNAVNQQNQTGNNPKAPQQQTQTPTNPQCAGRHTLNNYVIAHNINTQLDKQQTQEYLKEHIRNNLDAYLTTTILSNFRILTALSYKECHYYINDNIVYELLDKDPLSELQTNTAGEQETKELILEFRQLMRQAQNNKNTGTATLEDGINLLMFTRIWDPNSQGDNDAALDELTDLVNQYKANKNKQVDKKYTKLAQHFDAIVQQLEIEIQVETGDTQNARLTKVTTAVKEFSKAYKAKIAEQNVNERNSNQNNNQANKETTHQQLGDGFKKTAILLNECSDKLFHTGAVNFFKTANKVKDIENIAPERLLQLLQTQHPEYLAQLVYAHFLKFDINIYNQAEQQEKFNDYLDIIIQSDQLVIDEQNPSTIDHPLATNQELESNSISLVNTNTQKAKEILRQLLLDIANHIDNDPNNSEGTMNNLNKQTGELSKHDKETQTAIITIGKEIIKILQQADANSESYLSAQGLHSQNKTAIQLKLETITQIITTLEKQQRKTSADNKATLTQSNPKQSNPKQTSIENQNGPSQIESSPSISPMTAVLGDLTNKINHLTKQNNDDQEEKTTIALILRIQQILSKLHAERINKLTTSINMLEQRQQHQEQMTKYSQQVTQQLLGLFEQLNQSGALGPISDNLTQPFEAIAQVTKQFKETRAKETSTENKNDDQIQKLQKLYSDTIEELKTTKKTQRQEHTEETENIIQQSNKLDSKFFTND